MRQTGRQIRDAGLSVAVSSFVDCHVAQKPPMRNSIFASPASTHTCMDPPCISSGLARGRPDSIQTVSNTRNTSSLRVEPLRVRVQWRTLNPSRPFCEPYRQPALRQKRTILSASTHSYPCERYYEYPPHSLHEYDTRSPSLLGEPSSMSIVQHSPVYPHNISSHHHPLPHPGRTPAVGNPR